VTKNRIAHIHRNLYGMLADYFIFNA